MSDQFVKDFRNSLNVSLDKFTYFKSCRGKILLLPNIHWLGIEGLHNLRTK